MTSGFTPSRDLETPTACGQCGPLVSDVGFHAAPLCACCKRHFAYAAVEQAVALMKPVLQLNQLCPAPAHAEAFDRGLVRHK